jgi:DNA-binding transcriptional regulator YdaS (Cro superfamily)
MQAEDTISPAATEPHPLDVAAALIGGRAVLASALGVTSAAIGNWKTRGVPVEHCIAIERASSGAVTCEQLRPDKALDFAYLRTSAKLMRPAMSMMAPAPSPVAAVEGAG